MCDTKQREIHRNVNHVRFLLDRQASGELTVLQILTQTPKCPELDFQCFLNFHAKNIEQSIPISIIGPLVGVLRIPLVFVSFDLQSRCRSPGLQEMF